MLIAPKRFDFIYSLFSNRGVKKLFHSVFTISFVLLAKKVDFYVMHSSFTISFLLNFDEFVSTIKTMIFILGFTWQH